VHAGIGLTVRHPDSRMLVSSLLARFLQQIINTLQKKFITLPF